MSELGESLIQGAMEALQYAQGEHEGAKVHEALVPTQVDVMAIRKKMHMSRQKFCEE